MEDVLFYSSVLVANYFLNFLHHCHLLKDPVASLGSVSACKDSSGPSEPYGSSRWLFASSPFASHRVKLPSADHSPVTAE